MVETNKTSKSVVFENRIYAIIERFQKTSDLQSLSQSLNISINEYETESNSAYKKLRTIWEEIETISSISLAEDRWSANNEEIEEVNLLLEELCNAVGIPYSPG